MTPLNLSLKRSLANMQATLKETRDSLGKLSKPINYINEIRLLGFALHGNYVNSLHIESLSRPQLKLLRRVICLNTQLICTHVAHKQRKEACRQLVLRHQAKSST